MLMSHILFIFFWGGGGGRWHIHRSGVLAALFGYYMAGATWNCCRFGAHRATLRYINTTSGTPLMQFGGAYVPCVYLVFILIPAESCCRRRRGSLPCSCDVFRALINSLCRVYTSAQGLILFQIILLFQKALYTPSNLPLLPTPPLPQLSPAPSPDIIVMVDWA